MARAHSAGGMGMRTPMASSRSALPHWLEIERLPCLATRTPAPATTNATTVEMLKVRKPVAAGAAGIQQRLAAEPGIHRLGHLPQRTREAHQFVDGLAFHAQRHQKSGDLRHSTPARSG